MPEPQAITRTRMPAAEWALRVELAAMYRIFDHLGWTELIYNHITARVPGTDRHFLINPFGLHYREVTASNLVKIDLQGNKLDDSPHPVNPAGFVVHAAIHDRIPGAHVVMHTHTTAGMAVACSPPGLEMTNFYAAQLHDMVAYHDFEGITVHADEAPRLLHSLGDKPLLILRNHGLLAVGGTLPHAFALLWTLQRACEIQLATNALGRGAIPVSDAVARKCTRDSLQFDPRFGAGRDVFDALRRLVDARDGSYQA
jgi:ribulose-5-phosphate 4-epimerase/fuculose-1-phosphate aldolase